jgi:TPR repeat protein
VKDQNFSTWGTIMRNAKLWPAAFLGLLWWPGPGRPQGPGPDEANAQRAKALLEQAMRHYQARDFAAAVPHFLEAARLGNAAAQRKLGNMYEAGEGVPEDWAESARWRKLAASQKGPADLSALARAYVFGIGVPQSRAKAVDLYEQAAALGDKDAARWAKHYRDPTSGSVRNEEERRVFGLLPTVLPSDPVGRAFKSSEERLAYLKGQVRSAEHRNAEFRYLAQMYGAGGYVEQKRAYDDKKPPYPFPPFEPLRPFWEQPVEAAEVAEAKAVQAILAGWANQTGRVADGVTYASARFGGATLHAVRVRIGVRNDGTLQGIRIGYAPEPRTLQEFVRENAPPAVGAVTGTFSNYPYKDKPPMPGGPVVHDSKLVAANRTFAKPSSDPSAPWVCVPRSFLGYGPQGLFVKDAPAFDTAEQMSQFVGKLSAQEGVGGLGRLLDAGRDVHQSVATEQQKLKAGQADDGPNARAVAGVSNDHQTLILLVQEGDSRQQTGAGLGELARMLKRLGAWDAVIMDGGGSAQIVIQPPGQKEPTINNRPGGKARRLPTAILF